MYHVEQVEQLTLFPQGTRDHASLSALPGTEKARMMTVTSGQRLSGYYKKSTLSGLLVRTLLDISHWDSTLCYLTWRVSATPGKRLLFRLHLSERITKDTGFSLLPTPTASETKPRKNVELTGAGRRKCKNGSSHSLDLPTTLKMLGTPTASQNYKPIRKLSPSEAKGEHGKALPGSIGEAYPETIGEYINPQFVEWMMGFPEDWTKVG